MSFLASFLRKKNQPSVSAESHLVDDTARVDKAWSTVRKMIANIQSKQSVFHDLDYTDLELFIDVIENAVLRSRLLRTVTSQCSVDDVEALYRTPFVKMDFMELHVAKGMRHIKRCMARRWLDGSSDDPRQKILYDHMAILQQEALHELEEGPFKSIEFGVRDGRTHPMKMRTTHGAFTRAWVHACGFLFQDRLPSIRDVVNWDWGTARNIGIVRMSEGIQHLHKRYPTVRIKEEPNWNVYASNYYLGDMYPNEIASSEERVWKRKLSKHHVPGELRSFGKQLLAAMQWFLASGVPAEMMAWSWHQFVHYDSTVQQYLWRYVCSGLPEDTVQRMMDFMYILSTGSLKSKPCSLPTSVFDDCVSPQARVLGSFHDITEMMQMGEIQQLLLWWNTHYHSVKTHAILSIDACTLESP